MSVGNSSQLDMLTQYAERMGLNPEKLGLLNGGDTSELMLRLLSERSGLDDPISIALVGMLLRQQRRPVTPASAPESEDQASSTNRDPQPSGVQRASLILSRVASLLGACPTCCGLEALCRHCHGSGSPGTALPDAELIAWVLPAVERLGARMVSSDARAPASTTSPLSNSDNQF